MKNLQPLATRLRPQNWQDVVGQEHLLAQGRPLYKCLTSGHCHSMILCGPPGIGKTTLAECLAQAAGLPLHRLSAVLAGVKDVRAILAEAKAKGQARVLLFVDEVHRFNKSQQDAFLPHLESGLIVLIGATTENPSFALNNALLSRCRVYMLKALQDSDIKILLQRAAQDPQLDLQARGINFSDDAITWLIDQADGDARRALNALEMVSDFIPDKNAVNVDEINRDLVTADELSKILNNQPRQFDKNGDHYYEQISALHKSVRGSDPDAALYWLARLLDGGCDPAVVARRLLRMAAEEIGLADPRALQITLTAWQAYERVGSPEGDLILAEATAYLACCAKSNAVYKAWNDINADIKNSGSLPVPMELRNATTGLQKSSGYGAGYRYAHNEADAVALGAHYLPDALRGKIYYHPHERGLEIKISQKLAQYRAAQAETIKE